VKNHFTIYIDESGSASLNPIDLYPYFSMGGIIVQDVHKDAVKESVVAFKEKWEIDYPLHGAEIRSKKKRFAWLAKDPTRREQFLAELEELILGLPVIVVACVVSRPGYIARFGSEYGVNIWELRKTAFNILVERAAKYIDRQDGTLDVVFEKAGRREDELVVGHFIALRREGAPFHVERSSKYAPMAAAGLAQVLTTIEGRHKENNLLQVADLCLHPVAQGRDKPNNRPFAKMVEQRLLIDCHLASHEVETLGVKYFCFASNL
jgi:hypothetical protein